MTIIQYPEDGPTPEELTEMMKKAFAKMGYDTPEKRKEWYEKQCKPIAILCMRVRDV